MRQDEGLRHKLTRKRRCGLNLRAQQPLRWRSTELTEGEGEGGGVSDGLLGAPLNVRSISTNSLSCK